MAAVTIICSLVIVSLMYSVVTEIQDIFVLNVSLQIINSDICSSLPFTPQITTGEAYLVHTKRLHSNSQFNQYLSALYKVVGTFLFGAAVSQSLTDLAKFTIGRPRPNFLAVCAPVVCNGYMLQINCTGNMRNVTESRCGYSALHLSSLSFNNTNYSQFYTETSNRSIVEYCLVLS